MANPLIIPSIFTAVDQMSPKVAAMRNNIIGFGNTAQASISKIDRTVRKLTPGLGTVQKQLLGMVGIGAAVGGAFQLGSFSFNEIANYEQAVDSFRVIVSDLNDTDFSKFQNEIDRVAASSKRTGTEVAQSFEKIAGINSTFADTAEGLGQVTEASITLSKAARMDLGASAENLVGIMNQFSFGAGEANRTINVLAAGQAVGAANITQTAEAFTVFGSVAAGSNVTLEESVGLIQTLGKYSLYGAEAGTKLRGVMLRMQKAGIGYASGQFNINDALNQTNGILGKLHSAKQKDQFINKLFGVENVTAGRILLNNVGVYEKFTGAVTGTTEAQKAAEINTGNLRETIKQLGASWVNLLTTSDGAKNGISQLSDALKWLSNNLSTVVDVAVTALKVIIGYKVAMIAAKTAMLAWNITLGLSSALQGASSLAMQGNTVALAAQKVGLMLTRGALIGTTVVTEGATAATWSLNAAMAANPIGIVVLAVAALAAGIGYLIFLEKQLNEEYEKRSQLQVVNAMNTEVQTVDKLVDRYLKLGMNIKDATMAAIKFEKSAIKLDQIRVEGEIKQVQNQIRQNQVDVMGGVIDLPGTDRLRDKLIAKRVHAKELASQSLALTNYAISKTKDNTPQKQTFSEGDKFSGSELSGIFSNPVTENTGTKNELTLKINNGADVPVEVFNGKTKVKDVMPKTTSTKVL